MGSNSVPAGNGGADDAIICQTPVTTDMYAQFPRTNSNVCRMCLQDITW